MGLLVLEMLIHISLLGLSLFFLIVKKDQWQMAHYVLMVGGAFSFTHLFLKPLVGFLAGGGQKKTKTPQRADVAPVPSPKKANPARLPTKKQKTLNQRPNFFNGQRGLLQNLHFIEGEDDKKALIKKAEALSPFDFIRKNPLGLGQTQLAALDQMVLSLPRTFNKCLVVSNLGFEKRDGSLMESIRAERNIESLYCREIYNRIDLIPDFGNPQALNLLALRHLGDVLRGWLRQYDRVIFFMEESDLDWMKEIVYQGMAQSVALAPSYTFQSESASLASASFIASSSSPTSGPSSGPSPSPSLSPSPSPSLTSSAALSPSASSRVSSLSSSQSLTQL